MSSSPTIPSRIRGAIFGLAVVDALGGPMEFQPRRNPPTLTEMEANDNFDVPAGCWTDDTSMALCLAESLSISYPEYDAGDCVKRWIRWMNNGYMSSTGACFDIGNATLNALSKWQEVLGDRVTPGTRAYLSIIADTQKLVDKMFNKDSCCGNGSLMRVLPVGLLHFNDVERAVNIAEVTSRVTHPHTRNIQACQLYTALIVRAMSGDSKEVLCTIVANSTLGVDFTTKFKPLQTLEDWVQRKEKTVSSSGFVVNTLDAALWAFFSSSDFEEGAIKAVNLGNDADTVGAVYGGLAGAFYGIGAIPFRWLDQLVKKDIVESVLTRMLEITEKVGVSGETDSSG